MKKQFLILSVVAGFVACSSEGLRENAVQESKSLAKQYDPNRRSFAEAVEIAQNSINMLEEDKAATRSVTPARKLNLKDGVKAFCKAGTRSGEASSDNDTLFYVFNFEDNQGFSVVSASRHSEGLIAVVEEGNYDPDVPTGNPGFDTYMNMAKAYVAYKDKEGEEKETLLAKATTRQNPIYKHIYDTIYYQNIAPKVTVKWGQRYRMGQYCSNGLSGCTNTAAAQIMSYYKYPNNMQLTYSDRDSLSTHLSWTSLCSRIYAEHTYNWDNYDKQIGRLARQLGHSSGAQYNSGGTGTSIENEKSTLLSLGYSASSTTVYYFNNTEAGYPLAGSLAANKLILMQGYNSDNEGHVWIIDGCKYVKALERLMISYDGINWSVFQEMGTYRTCHNHINWGWNGRGNGYFNSWILNVYNSVQYDPYPLYTLSSGKNYSFYDNVLYYSVWH